MSQCRIIPFFGIFLRDLYAIVNDLPNVIIVGNENGVEKLSFISDINGVGSQANKLKIVAGRSFFVEHLRRWPFKCREDQFG